MRYIEEIIEDVRNGKPLSSRDEEIVAIAYIRGKYEGERKSKISNTSNNIEVINKIRAEMDGLLNDEDSHMYTYGVMDCLEIIDKYKKESEDNK